MFVPGIRTLDTSLFIYIMNSWWNTLYVAKYCQIWWFVANSPNFYLHYRAEMYAGRWFTIFKKFSECINSPLFCPASIFAMYKRQKLLYTYMCTIWCCRQYLVAIRSFVNMWKTYSILGSRICSLNGYTNLLLMFCVVMSVPLYMHLHACVYM